MNTRKDYYVYILFDAFAVPRWVGKGRGNRIDNSAKACPLDRNWQKAKFIEQTIEALKDVPRIIVQSHLTEEKAFQTEEALIKAIGRHPKGPLVNWTDGGSNFGPWYDRLSKSQRLEHASKATSRLTPEQRKENGRKGGIRSAEVTTPAQKSARGHKTWEGLTIEQRRLRTQNARAGLTPETIKENSRKANITYTPARRSTVATKIHADMKPETKAEASRKRSETLKARGVQPPKYVDIPISTRRNMVKIQTSKATSRWANMTAEQYNDMCRRISEGRKQKNQERRQAKDDAPTA